MARDDFSFEFTAQIEHPPEGLREEAEARLLEIYGGKSDVVGASLAVEEEAGGESPHVFRARVVIFIRGPDIVAVEKAGSPRAALSGALDAVERQVRERRRRRRDAARRTRRSEEGPLPG